MLLNVSVHFLYPQIVRLFLRRLTVVAMKITLMRCDSSSLLNIYHLRLSSTLKET
jgi:hypothetical protein